MQKTAVMVAAISQAPSLLVSQVRLQVALKV
jgi:hypothetical protein